MTPPPAVLPDQPEWSECPPAVPALGDLVQTACGGSVQYCPTTPCVMINGRTIYFCLPICKADFEANPHNSCLSLKNTAG